MSDRGSARGWSGLLYWAVGTATGFVGTVAVVGVVASVAESKWTAVIRASVFAAVLVPASLLLLRLASRALVQLNDAGQVTAAILAAPGILWAALVFVFSPFIMIARLNHDPHGPLGSAGLTGHFWPVITALDLGAATVAASAVWLILRLWALTAGANVEQQ